MSFGRDIASGAGARDVAFFAKIAIACAILGGVVGFAICKIIG